jgi:hypothetical protein
MRVCPTIVGLAAATAAAIPAFAADAVPDLSGFWGRARSISRRFRRRRRRSESVPAPLRQQRSDAPAGDYNNPILKAGAAAIVKARAEKALAGITFPDPSTRCAPYNPPFVAAMQLGVQFLQAKDRITILYNQDDQVRHVRLNGKHPARVTPSWKGDSIGITKATRC